MDTYIVLVKTRKRALRRLRQARSRLRPIMDELKNYPRWRFTALYKTEGNFDYVAMVETPSGRPHRKDILDCMKRIQRPRDLALTVLRMSPFRLPR